MKNKPAIVENASFKGCPRCEHAHQGLTFRVLLNDEHGRYWSTCPVTQQPFFATMTEAPATAPDVGLVQTDDYVTLVAGSR